ncbi:MAG: 50S ribosomal protein L24 [Candidatus Pacebacteria bacterium]|nr:50S ribosomal protein L24 [Candidatus Paceibacterota bacterium]
MKIKKGDTVLIISGKDKGKRAKVIKALPKEEKIIVEGVNLRKKSVRPKRTGEKGQIVTLPHPIYVSDAKIICPKCSQAARIGYKVENKKKYRICKKCRQEV